MVRADFSLETTTGYVVLFTLTMPPRCCRHTIRHAIRYYDRRPTMPALLFADADASAIRRLLRLMPPPRDACC